MWWGSLPLRVVVSTLLGSIVVLILGGLLLMQQAAAGIEHGKQASALAETSVALEYVERSMRDAATGQVTSNETLTRVAFEAVQRATVGGQYSVVVQGPVSDILTPGLDPNTVPASLRQTLAQATQSADASLFVTSTEVRYVNGQTATPGLVVGAVVGASGTTRYPIYFVYPMTTEQATLRILQQALITTGLVVIVALAGIAYWVARQVVGPVRESRLAAELLASGQLTERIPVRGTDDLARLAISMNFMASELQHRIRQLEELSRLQQRFVADVSHELRTPLTTVRLAASVLHEARSSYPPLEQRAAVLMWRELDRFEGLLADLLEISRFDAGAAELSLEETDLRELVTTEVDSLRAVARTYGVELELLAAEPCTAEIDSRRIGRVLRNLLTNAIEHGEGKPVQIEIAANEEAVAITVRDHGAGFEAGDSQNVFQRFWRADRARARSLGGSGLGLAISQEDVRLHGGYLNAWGRPRRGAKFRVTLPRKPVGQIGRSPLPMVPRTTERHLLGERADDVEVGL